MSKCFCHISIDGESYEVKDAKARNELTYIERNMDNIRKNIKNDLELVSYPIEMSSLYKNKVVFTGEKYKCSLNMKSYKVTNENPKTVYLAPNGVNDGNDGISRDNPLLTIDGACNRCVDGDTIILTPGVYTQANIGTGLINKSVNIIFEEGAYIFYGQIKEFTQDSTYSNLYKIDSFGNNLNVLDISNLDSIVKFKNVSSILECSTTPYSFITYNSTLYVNYNGDNPSNNIVILRDYGLTPFKFTNFTSDTKIYVENAKIYGGSFQVCEVLNNSEYDVQAVFNKCEFKFAKNAGFKNSNSKTICNECIASFNGGDGFSYVDNAEFLEHKCIGEGNGFIAGVPANTTNCNGSTAHNGSKGIRVDGKYFNSYGSNVADVQEGTSSLNYSCIAFDSLAGTENIHNSDFSAQQPGTTMYLYECYIKGSNSNCSIWSYDGTTIYTDELTKYRNTIGNVVNI